MGVLCPTPEYDASTKIYERHGLVISVGIIHFPYNQLYIMLSRELLGVLIQYVASWNGLHSSFTLSFDQSTFVTLAELLIDHRLDSISE